MPQVGQITLGHHGTIESPWKGGFPSSDGLRTTVDNILFQRGVQWLFRADCGQLPATPFLLSSTSSSCAFRYPDFPDLRLGGEGRSWKS